MGGVHSSLATLAKHSQITDGGATTVTVSGSAVIVVGKKTLLGFTVVTTGTPAGFGLHDCTSLTDTGLHNSVFPFAHSDDGATFQKGIVLRSINGGTYSLTYR